MWAKEWEVPPPYEAQIHNSVFNTLSRPFSSNSFLSSSSSNKSQTSSNMRMNSEEQLKHISWNHFGKKYNFHITDNEVQDGDRGSFYQVLMGKICDECPEFKGTLAFTNTQGKEVIIDCDSALRQALAESHNYLKLHTILNISSDSATNFVEHRPPSSLLAASDMLNKKFQSSPKRSNSVPPRRVIAHVENSARYYSSRSPSTAPHNSYSRTVYTQPMTYAMPPRNLVLSQLLLAGAGFHPAMAYPMFLPSSQRYVGPNKLCGMSPGRHYYKSGWGPAW